MTPYRQPFSLTEQHLNSAVPVNGPAREQFIDHQEAFWKSLPIPSLKHHPDDINTAAKLLSAIAFSDYSTPIPPSSHTPPLHHKTSRTRLCNYHIPTGTRVAVTGDMENEWFLATVLANLGDRYVVKDDDCEEGDVKTFSLQRSDIRVLPSPNQFLDPGWRVLAVYPDTTTFYPATVLRRKGTDWVVRFEDDDHDDDGTDDEQDGRLVNSSFIFRCDNVSSN